VATSYVEKWYLLIPCGCIQVRAYGIKFAMVLASGWFFHIEELDKMQLEDRLEYN
jgi:hypothetical protein